jgi:hypothetical protein
VEQTGDPIRKKKERRGVEMNAALCNDRGVVGTGPGQLTGYSETSHLIAV